MLITTEDGPFNLCASLRGIFIFIFGTNSWITKGIHCPLCVGFWLSWIFGTLANSVGFIDTNGYIEMFLAWFAIAGIQTFITLLAGIPGGEDG